MCPHTHAHGHRHTCTRTKTQTQTYTHTKHEHVSANKKVILHTSVLFIGTAKLLFSSPHISNYGTHQLQLQRDTRGTCRGHASCTRMFLSKTRNDMHHQLPSCTGLHGSSPPLYMSSLILHAHTCAGCDSYT